MMQLGPRTHVYPVSKLKHVMKFLKIKNSYYRLQHQGLLSKQAFMQNLGWIWGNFENYDKWRHFFKVRKFSGIFQKSKNFKTILLIKCLLKACSIHRTWLLIIEDIINNCERNVRNIPQYPLKSWSFLLCSVAGYNLNKFFDIFNNA